MGYPRQQLSSLWLLLSSPINAVFVSPPLIATATWSSPFMSRFAVIIVLISIFISCVRPPCWLFLLHPDFLFLTFVVASCFLLPPLSSSSPSSSSSSSTSFLWLVFGIEEMASMFGGLQLVHSGPTSDGGAGGHQDMVARFVPLTRNS